MIGDEPQVLKPRAPIKWLLRFAADNADVILSMYADECLSFDAIADRISTQIEDYSVVASNLRLAFLSDPRLAAMYNAAVVDRAHNVVEQALDHANSLQRGGDYARAAELKLKIAAKIAPRHYSDRVELAGPGATPLIGSSVGVPDSVLEAMVQGAAGTRLA